MPQAFVMPLLTNGFMGFLLIGPGLRNKTTQPKMSAYLCIQKEPTVFLPIHALQVGKRAEPSFEVFKPSLFTKEREMKFLLF